MFFYPSQTYTSSTQTRIHTHSSCTAWPLHFIMLHSRSISLSRMLSRKQKITAQQKSVRILACVCVRTCLGKPHFRVFRSILRNSTNRLASKIISTYKFFTSLFKMNLNEIYLILFHRNYLTVKFRETKNFQFSIIHSVNRMEKFIKNHKYKFMRFMFGWRYYYY